MQFPQQQVLLCIMAAFLHLQLSTYVKYAAKGHQGVLNDG